MSRIHPIFYGEILGGKITHDEPDKFITYLRTLKGRVSICVKRAYKKRTLPQNSYLHGVVFKLASEASGYELEEVKGILKYAAGIKSTADLSTVEEMEFIAFCQRFCITPIEQGGSGWDCYIPSPNEVDYSEDIINQN